MRSEGGAECRKIQDEMTASSGAESASNDTSAAVANASNGQNGSADATMKPDPDGNWTGLNGGGIVM